MPHSRFFITVGIMGLWHLDWFAGTSPLARPLVERSWDSYRHCWFSQPLIKQFAMFKIAEPSEVV